MVLNQKWPFFQLFFFRQYKAGKCLLPYSRTIDAFLRYKNKKFKTSKTWHFSKGASPWFWSKNGHFPTFFCRQYWPGKCLLPYSRTIDAFLGFKKQEVQKIEKLTFLQNPWFWSKNGHFSSFIFLGNIGKENVFYDILGRRNAFLGHKNKKFKRSKNWHSVPKGVNPLFWSKNDHFSNFIFLGSICQENVFYDILER